MLGVNWQVGPLMGVGRGRAWVGLGGIALVFGLAACGDEAPPAQAVAAPEYTCTLSAVAVAGALASDVTLLRHDGDRLCVFGAERSPDHADHDQPFARLAWVDELPALPKDVTRKRKFHTTSRTRPDLDSVAWQRDWTFRDGRHRTQLAFVRPGGGYWVTTVDVPKDEHADEAALEGAESLHDALVDPAAAARS